MKQIEVTTLTWKTKALDWFVFLVAPFFFIYTGVTLESEAMQWFGLILSFVVIMFTVYLVVRQDKTYTLAEAAALIREMQEKEFTDTYNRHPLNR